MPVYKLLVSTCLKSNHENTFWASALFDIPIVWLYKPKIKVLFNFFFICLKTCDSEATCGFHGSSQQNQQNGSKKRTVVILPLKFYNLSSPRKTQLKGEISNKMCSCQLKELCLQRLKVFIWQLAFQKMYFLFLFFRITEGFVTYFYIRWGPLGSDGRILSCIGTCTCPTQIHGQQWECTEGTKMQRKTRGDYHHRKKIYGKTNSMVVIYKSFRWGRGSKRQ